MRNVVTACKNVSNELVSSLSISGYDVTTAFGKQQKTHGCGSNFRKMVCSKKLLTCLDIVVKLALRLCMSSFALHILATYRVPSDDLHMFLNTLNETFEKMKVIKTYYYLGDLKILFNKGTPDDDFASEIVLAIDNIITIIPLTI